MQKGTDFLDIYLTILEATQVHSNFVFDKSARVKDRGI